MRIIETKEGSVLEVSVRPRSREFKIAIDGEEMVVHCVKEPAKGKANKEIIRELARLFRTEVVLVSGFASNRKRFLIKQLGKSEVEAIVIRG